MHKKRISFLLILMGFQLSTSAQSLTVAEPQISFAKEIRPFAYYVAQAELWWAEVEKDKSSEEAWYNYYKACRNAHGSNNWKKNFVEVSPDLRLGQNIVAMVEENIPNTFTHYFLKGADLGVSTEGSKYLKKAYKMKPDFPPIHSFMVTYATSSHNPGLRKEVNQKWFKTNEWSQGLMSYGYNVLASTAPDAILFTQGDNDTYPIWMLQDALGLRTDVWVINIDFLLFEEFRKPVFEKMGVPAFILENIDINEYEQNWKSVVKHVLSKYKGDKPLYLAMTVDQEWFEGFENRLSPVGLAWKMGQKQKDLSAESARLIKDEFMLDYLRGPLTYDIRQKRLEQMDLNYLKSFAQAYTYNKEHQLPTKRISSFAEFIMSKTDRKDIHNKYQEFFKD
ncbi:MAG: hypothetical protein MRZ79_23370 [Bacteroidia bacterium]|nr:hypothetical protein [Bacteroidia bacterium]